MLFFKVIFNVLIAISPLSLAALVVGWAFAVTRRKNQRQKLKWQVDELFDEEAD